MTLITEEEHSDFQIKRVALAFNTFLQLKIKCTHFEGGLSTAALKIQIKLSNCI